MAVPEHPLDELPLYLDDDGPRRPGAPPAKYTARDVAVRVSHWVGDLVDGDGSMAPPTNLDAGEGAKDDVVVIHRVLGDPRVLLAAFDERWGVQPSRTRGAWGTLALRPQVAPAGWQRTLPGHLHLRISFAGVPVELEVTPWHTYGLVLCLRPVRHVKGAIGWHRRWAWFAAGHRILDQMRRTLETAGRADRPT